MDCSVFVLGHIDIGADQRADNIGMTTFYRCRYYFGCEIVAHIGFGGNERHGNLEVPTGHGGLDWLQ